MNIVDKIISLADEKYRDFSSALLPNVDKSRIIGVRSPQLRALAKEIKKSGEEREFLSSLPHKYHDENNLHGFILNGISDFDECIEAVESFLPYVDNWATCDSLRPAVFKKNTDKLLPYIRKWIASEHSYTVRFAIEMLMCYYLDDEFCDEYPKLVARVESGEYYVKMMQAWYFATALAKRWDSIVPYIEEQGLDAWVHNKTLQKAIESYRITEAQKKYLKGFRR